MDAAEKKAEKRALAQGTSAKEAYPNMNLLIPLLPANIRLTTRGVVRQKRINASQSNLATEDAT